jgi:Phage portal protein, SPP1 Gp6-like
VAPPQTDSDWLNNLSIRHDAEKPELEELDRYYEGTQPLTYMHPEIFREVHQRIKPVIIAWPQLVVDSVEERLDVEGFRLPDDEAADADLWRVWQANGLDETSQQGHIDALVMRRAYACVGSNEDDAATPLVTVESPLEMFADIDPRTRKVRAALRRVMEVEDFARTNERTATLYLPNKTVWYRWDGGWKVEDQDEHGLGEVPVVPLTNRGRLTRSTRLAGGRTVQRYGRSDLAQIIPLSDAANKLATDMMVASEFVALPLRGFFGLGPDDLVDENGQKMTKLQVIMGRLVTIAENEGKEFEFAAADLSNFHKSIAELAQMVAALSGLPPHYIGMSTDNPASADAIRSAESRLVKRAERKQRAFGGGWEQVCRLVKRFQASGEKLDPKLLSLETVWRDASTPTVAQAADAAVKLFSTPTPIVPLRQTRESLGYSQTQITRMEQEDEKVARLDPVAQIARDLAAGAEPEQQTPPGAVTKEQADVFGQLFRAGVTGESAADKAGIGHVDMVPEARPITIKDDDEEPPAPRPPAPPPPTFSAA